MTSHIWQARLDDLDNQIGELANAIIGDVAPRLIALEQRATSTEAPTVGTGEVAAWHDRADDQAWAVLREWVDWLTRCYELVGEARRLPGCWPQHLGVVEELAALRDAWTVAVVAGGDAMVAWHENLTRALGRITASPIRACAGGHRPVTGTRR